MASPENTGKPFSAPSELPATPYAVFAGMLASGNPPGDWPALLAAVAVPEEVRRFDQAAGKTAADGG